MARTQPDERFSDKQARQRFEAALRGARVVGHKPVPEMKVGKKGKATATMKRRALRKNRNEKTT
jgi:hypothetical protein